MRVKALPAFLVVLLLIPGGAFSDPGWKVVAWNDLGMHCMDADYSVFAILPPFNTIHAQVIDPAGRLVGDPQALKVTYEAAADPNGSINTTSQGKTNFWQYARALFGVSLDPDTGLAGNSMPGASNTPQPMVFDTALSQFTPTGIPLTPRDDSGQKNFYPLLKVTVRDATGSVLASVNTVAPVSDEMTCSACHASGSPTMARPSAGWVYDSDPERDYKLNILRKHDELQANTDLFIAGLAKSGYNPTGLYDTAAGDGNPVLCANCHLSNALPGLGMDGVPPLTRSIHASHAAVSDPDTGVTLDNTSNREACYRCHPGSTTQCLRGAMGKATAADGTMLMQCQSCHGSMSGVGGDRVGWLEEPSCQQCHTGDAANNAGQIRYTSVFDSAGNPRFAPNRLFATNPDTPAAGVSLYRFSAGHGGLQCEACHGSTHAEYSTSQANDNLQSIALQGHSGKLVECTACHPASPNNTAGGPHGMHPVGAPWVSQHRQVAERSGASACTPCHGLDFRGSVLSQVAADRAFAVEGGLRMFAAATVISCYSCHNGPRGE